MRRAGSASRSPTSIASAGRTRWCSTAARWWPTAMARCDRPRRRIPSRCWWSVSIRRRVASARWGGGGLGVALSAGPVGRHKHASRSALLEAATGRFGVPIAYVNCVGGQDAVVFDGGSLVAGGDGTVRPAAAAYTEQMLVVDFDPETRGLRAVEWMEDGD